MAAFRWALGRGERIFIRISYQVEDHPAYEEQVPALKASPLVKQRLEQIEALRAEFI